MGIVLDRFHRVALALDLPALGVNRRRLAGRLGHLELEADLGTEVIGQRLDQPLLGALVILAFRRAGRPR